MTEWIYESPDGGKTVFRRYFGRYEDREKMLNIDAEGWMPMSEVVKLAKNSVREQGLRHEHPILNEAWETYHTLLRLLGKYD
jgi:hypothetical protein